MRWLLSSMWFTLAALVLVAVFGVWLFRRMPELKSASREAARADEKIADVREEQERLAREQQYRASQAYLERQARIQFGLKKTGEEVVYVYRSTDESPAPTQTSDALTNFELWWYYLIKRKP